MILLKILSLFLALLSLNGCAGIGREVRWSDPGADRVWPDSPEKARIQHLRTLTTDFGRKDEYGGRLLRWMVGEAPSARMLMPYGVAADGAGRIWVADGAGQRVHLFDLARGRVGAIPSAGGEPFSFPVGVAVDARKDQLFVSDSGLGKVFRLDLSGRLKGEVAPPEGFKRPAGLAVDGEGNLYVLDALAGTIEIFSSQGVYLRTLGSGLSPDGRFKRPSSIAVDLGERIYVVDSLNFRVEVLSSGGETLATIGGIGDSPGRFARPRGIALDPSGNIYVSDAAFDNIQIFNPAGELLLAFGRAGKGKGEFCMPAGLAADPHGRIYAVDSCNGRIQLFQVLK